MPKTTGVLWGLGIGPGDPDLITLKAFRLLQSVDIIAYPAPEVGASLARQIAAPHIPKEAEEIILRLPIGPDLSLLEAAYDRAAATLAKALEDGKSVAVLCEGDPFFYGSFMYLFDRLGGRYPIEVVPGVSSIMACAAQAQQPLVSRNESLLVIPATLSEDLLAEKLDQAQRSGHALVFMKLGRHFAKIRRLLEQRALLETAIYVEHVGHEDEKILSASEVSVEAVPYFSMLLLPTAA